MYEFWLGFMTCAWLATLIGGGYLGYQYVYLPWKVMRADMRSLDQKVTNGLLEMKNEMGLRKALAPSDDEAAMAERAARTSRYLR